ncbi:hypothetical protein [Fluviispira multicolorata]|uniref:Na+-driven multidrug efflux pump n=1 Tax=Fluviispira multicolorata TaxID=2654512 RepID=A0A833JE06_9BACT|nr:hypothetical protein [Fluviispira multicolorata]KAB8031007.1 hypothetical protein GCL57_08550 [Fluviispira multicolorata]
MKTTFIQKMIALWKEFLPLSVSDVTMALGDPLVNTTLAQMPHSQTNLASLGIVKSFVVLFESPIIMMLHASNALSGDKGAREALWRFVLISCISLTVLLSLLAIPFIFFPIMQYIIGVSNEISKTAHKILLCLLFWPASIALRRYFQGILIIHGQLKTIARAGLLRLLVLFFCLVVGYLLHVQSSYLAGCSLMLAVASETIVIFLASIKYKNSFLETKININEKYSYPKTIKEIWNYYWPLAHSMVLVWGGRSLMIVCLARAVDSSLALAIWPAAWSLILVFSNTTRMIQQVIIRNKDKYHPADFIIFALSVGTFLSALLLFLSISRFGKNLLISFVGQNAFLLDGMQRVLMICFCIPILIAIQNVLQGFLISSSKTNFINRATLFGTGILLISVYIGILLQYLGASVAGFSMVIALMLEILILTTQIPWKFYIHKYAQQQTIQEKVL